jgi:N-acetylmuramoyl-L-alanine amidase
MRKINKIIVHCTATPENRFTSVDNIRQWHKAKGWRDIGYHYVIYLDGTVHEGRPVEQIGSHCKGHNSNSIGIVYVGGIDAIKFKEKDTRNPAQKAALLGMLKYLKNIYPSAEIHGHRDFAAKACPSFDARKEYEDL